MEAPYFWSYINSEVSQNAPGKIKVHDSSISAFFRRYLFQKAISVCKWKMPKWWRKEFVQYTTYGIGYMAIFNTDRFGVIPQPCGLRGFGVQYEPTHAVISNPLLRGIREPRIDEQCVLLRLQPDYGGILDIVNYYGDMMALFAESVGMNVVNSKLSYVFTAKSAAAAKSFDKMYDKILDGETAVIQDKDLLNDDGTKAWEAFEQNVGQNYIAGDLLSDMRKIEYMFDTAIGIPNANTEKRERNNTEETHANDIETVSLCALWLENLKDSCEKANSMFPGLGLEVDWRFPPNVEGGSKDESNNVNTRTLPVR